jgi:hypothetical protein
LRVNLQLFLIMLAYSAPAFGLGVLVGALGWQPHRLMGAAVGGLAGLLLGLLFWWIYLNTDLSVHFDPDELILTGLRRGWPGMLAGAVIGAFITWRWIFGAVCGAILGIIPGLVVWWLLYG